VDIVIDEWIVHYIAEPDKRNTALGFLERLLAKCDCLVTMKGGGLDRKVFQMAEECAGCEVKSMKLAKWFMKVFRWNSDKFRVLEESEAAVLPSGLEKAWPQDDLFLLKATLSTGAPILTIDGGLKSVASETKEVVVRMLDEFIEEYDC